MYPSIDKNIVKIKDIEYLCALYINRYKYDCTSKVLNEWCSRNELRSYDIIYLVNLIDNEEKSVEKYNKKYGSFNKKKLENELIKNNIII
jgi:hypothetical protein